MLTKKGAALESRVTAPRALRREREADPVAGRRGAVKPCFALKISKVGDIGQQDARSREAGGKVDMEELLKVLLVEDDSTDALLISRALKKSAAHVELVHVRLLSQALEELRTRTFDVVLLDLSLPDEKGLGTLEKVIEANRTVPIVILTGLEDEELALQAMKEGADDYFFKGEISNPFFLRSIHYSIERKRGREALRKAHDELELRVEQRTGELARSNRALQEEIFERQRAQEEREHLIVELQEALGHVKTLSGLLPICASCKKIRDDKGYWNQIESYIRKHSSAEFTHSCCPECAKRLYPEYVDEKGHFLSTTFDAPPNSG